MGDASRRESLRACGVAAAAVVVLTISDPSATRIEGATTDTFYLMPGSPAVGRTLGQLDLRGETRALVIAVVREDRHTLSPGPEFEFRAGDILVLVGDHAAFVALSPEPRDPGAGAASRAAGTERAR